MTILDSLSALVGNPPPVVSVIRLQGLIGRGGPVRHGLTLAGQAGIIERAFKPKGLKAVALAINSPGGSPVQSSLIAGRIRQLADEHKVPVFAFCEDVAASGGYWLAVAADEIFADPASVVGSIGVVSAGFGFTELIQKLGVERRLYAQGAYKGMLDPFQPEKEPEVERLKAIQADLFETFKAHVRTRRQGRLKAPEDELFSGNVWTGRQALELGLVDGLGDLRSVLRGRFGEEVRLRALVEPRGWLRRKFGMAGPEDLIETGLATLEERLERSRFGL